MCIKCIVLEDCVMHCVCQMYSVGRLYMHHVRQMQDMYIDDNHETHVTFQWYGRDDITVLS